MPVQLRSRDQVNTALAAVNGPSVSKKNFTATRHKCLHRKQEFELRRWEVFFTYRDLLKGQVNEWMKKEKCITSFIYDLLINQRFITDFSAVTEHVYGLQSLPKSFFTEFI